MNWSILCHFHEFDQCEKIMVLFCIWCFASRWVLDWDSLPTLSDAISNMSDLPETFFMFCSPSVYCYNNMTLEFEKVIALKYFYCTEGEFGHSKEMSLGWKFSKSYVNTASFPSEKVKGSGEIIFFQPRVIRNCISENVHVSLSVWVLLFFFTKWFGGLSEIESMTSLLIVHQYFWSSLFHRNKYWWIFTVNTSWVLWV